MESIVLIIVHVFLSACSGSQSQSVVINQQMSNGYIGGGIIALGKQVKKLGKNIDCIRQDKNGKYWIASNGDGVFTYDGKKILQLTTDDGLCSNYVFSMEFDTKDNIWFTTRDGICMYNGMYFINYTDSICRAPFNEVRFTKKSIFFSHRAGICMYDGQTFTNFSIAPQNNYKDSQNLNRSYGMYATWVDNEGDLWIGTQSQGVCKYDGKNKIFIRDSHLAGPAVRSIYQDKWGMMWFGNNGGGLFSYDGKNLINVTEKFDLGNPEFLQGKFSNKTGTMARVFAIQSDEDGNLWIGTIDAGLWKYDGRTLTNYNIEKGLIGNSIWTMYKNQQQELLFVIDGVSIWKISGNQFVQVIP